MQNSEKRQFERIPHAELPATFKKLLADIGDNRSLNAETIDISTMGIGVNLTFGPDMLDQVDHIELYSHDNRYRFSGRITRAEKIGDRHYRLGVLLQG
jgi:hypothetical protein